MAQYKDNDEFLFGGSSQEEQNEELAFLNKESKNQDGIYRPKLEDAADPKGVGYKATIRFLRNVLRDGSGTGPAAVQKHVHYADFKNNPELSGYYDCEKNVSQQSVCPLCQTYWKLAKSNNQADVEKSKLIKRSTKFYSYILVIEDEQHPELVGKILVYPYGAKIKAKINAEINGEIGDKCNIFDFVTGKDFRLIIKLVKTPAPDGRGPAVEMPNYDTSQFKEISPLKIYNEKAQKFMTPPVVEVNGKSVISDTKWQAKIKEVLTSRSENVNIEDHMPAKDGLPEDKKANVEKILSILSGNDVFHAETSVRKTATKAPANILEDDTIDDFFFDSDSDSDDLI